MAQNRGDVVEYMPKRKPGDARAAGAHGGGVRGEFVNRGSRVFEGRFGRLFRTLPAAEFGSADLEELALRMSAEPERDGDKPVAAAETADRIQDGEENTGISAGYTYLGQFIDHDITFDPASSLQKRNDPDGLIDFRTPALDLDNVYGRGPDDQPYLYDAGARKFVLGDPLSENIALPPLTFDVPRMPQNKRAVIGDKRNDENVIVSQLHSTFLQFHNRVADDNPRMSFAEIQKCVRWHYQYIVLHDFLPRIVGEKTMDAIWKDRKTFGNVCGHGPTLCFYHFHDSPFLPIEFSAAAFRFGHSMVRPIYRLNTKHTQNGPTDSASIAGRFFIFAGVQERGLNGFGQFPRHWAIDWSLYFDINGSGAKGGRARVQPAYKIDTSLVNPLAFLPEFSAEPAAVGTRLTIQTLQSAEVTHRSPNNLAIRNLLRGNSMGLPSGEDTARAMGLVPLTPAELWVGKAQKLDDGTPDKVSDIADIASGEFLGKSPLWFYCLAEANAQWLKAVKGKSVAKSNTTATSLGPVGGRIVAETLIGLLLGDSHSFVNQDPLWKPSIPMAKPDTFTMGDFIRYALRI
jgi:Animal haem peroxidase